MDNSMSSLEDRALLTASCAGLAISAKASRYWCLAKQVSIVRQVPQATLG
jgi:hypothetical protein